jgi:hypothetical protein
MKGGKTMAANPEQTTRSIGAKVSEELYWKFVQARADRHEPAAKALEIAIMLYLESVPDKKEEDS